MHKHTIYVFDKQTKTDRGDNVLAATFNGDDADEAATKLHQWMNKHEPRHYTTYDHDRRYRILIAS